MSKRANCCITKVPMPERERTAHPGCESTRNVRLLAWSTNSLWIGIDDIEWLVTWLASEHGTGGVPLEADPLDELAPNCAAPGVHIRWHFDGAWEAAVVSGAEQGKKVKCYVEKLTLEKWTDVNDVHKYGVAFEAATAEQRKQATFHYLEQHLQRALAATG